jgi:peptide subunit release factor 1 (eRF1)
MISRADLQQLLAFEDREQPVLSAYLNLEPARQLRRSYRIAFVDLRKALREQLDEAARAAFEREADRVEQYLAEAAPRGKGLAVFSCTPRGLWQAHYLPQVVADDLRFGPTPYLEPLLDVLDEYERYAVALVDKEKVRLFSVYLGEIEEEREFLDAVPGKHKQGGWAQARYQRHHETHVHWHLKRVADALADLLRHRPFDRLVLAGPPEATSELQALLPPVLRARLAGVFPAEMFASEAEILRQTLEIERQIERANEERLVAQLLEQAGSGGRATIGVAPTLQALWRGQVHRLVVAEGVRLAGGECSQCGWLEADSATACPTCGATMTPLADLVERAVERTVEARGRVEVVHGPAAERLRAAGGLGAVLRFSG